MNKTGRKIGHEVTKATRLKMSLAGKGRKAWNKGIPMSEEAKLKLSKTNTGKTWSEEHIKKRSISIKKAHSTKGMRKKKSLLQKGSKGSNWQGGITSMNICGRNTSKYRDWREEVFKRDNYECQEPECKSKRGSYIEAHHIKSYSKHIELRYDIGNGITLCKKCHSKTIKKETHYEKKYFKLLAL